LAAKNVGEAIGIEIGRGCTGAIEEIHVVEHNESGGGPQLVAEAQAGFGTGAQPKAQGLRMGSAAIIG
jgi:hypothetical protein